LSIEEDVIARGPFVAAFAVAVSRGQGCAEAVTWGNAAGALAASQ
jgi:hypothetical protein